MFTQRMAGEKEHLGQFARNSWSRGGVRSPRHGLYRRSIFGGADANPDKAPEQWALACTFGLASTPPWRGLPLGHGEHRYHNGARTHDDADGRLFC